MLDSIRELRRLANLGGWIFTDAVFLAAKVEIDADRAARWLPGGLRLARPATATLFIAHYPQTSFGSVYNEAGLFVDVRRRFRAAVHCPWMLVDDDIALILGRELLGYPKKLGTFAVSLDGDEVDASVERKGVKLLHLHGKVGRVVSDPPPMLARRVYNAWGPIGLSLQKLLTFTPTEQILEAREVELTVQIRPAPLDPLHELGVGQVLEAHRYRVNIGGSGVPLPVRSLSPLYLLRSLTLRYR